MAKYGEDHAITKAYKAELNQDTALDKLADLIAAVKDSETPPDLSGASPVSIASRNKVSMRKIADWRNANKDDANADSDAA